MAGSGTALMVMLPRSATVSGLAFGPTSAKPYCTGLPSAVFSRVNENDCPATNGTMDCSYPRV